MANNQDISDRLIRAVCDGNEEIVRELINTYGLSYSDAWSEGYHLLCVALRNKQRIVANILLNYNCKINYNKSIFSRNSCTPLHSAVKNGDIEIVKILLNKGANIEAKDEYRKTPLHYATIDKQYQIVELLLRFEAGDNEVQTPLHTAVLNKEYETVELLLLHKADVNIRNNNGTSPLYCAVVRGNFKIIEILLKYGAVVQPEDVNDDQFFYNAIKLGFVKIVEDLLKFGADVNKIFKHSNRTPIQVAVLNHEENVTRLLINYGANLNVQDIEGNTLLFYAVRSGDLNMVKLLLQHKVDINHINKDGKNVLHISATAQFTIKKVEIVTLLLSNGADINVNTRDNDGRTPIYYVVEIENSRMVEILLKYGAVVQPEDVNDDQFFYNAIERGFVKIVEDLLKFGADVNKIFKELYHSPCPLHLAVLWKWENMTKLLISYGANLNVQDRFGNTPIFYAVRSGDLNMIKLLLQHKVDINHINKEGTNVLHTAATSEGIEGMATLLLSHGVDVNVKQNCDGSTALHLAADSDNHKFIKKLLEYCSSKVDSKMDINCRNKNGKTPLQLAISNKNVENVRTLLDYGSNINYSDFNKSNYYHRRENSTLDTVLISHLVKLKTANLFISTENLIFIENIDDEIKDFENKCEQEIERMKIEKINDTNLSFYDILTRLNKNTSWLKNENIVEDLTTDGYKTKYPIYANMIANEFNKGIKRYNLLGKSIEMWRCVFNNVTPQLPLDCVERVFSYLSYEDLKIFNKCL